MESTPAVHEQLLLSSRFILNLTTAETAGGVLKRSYSFHAGTDEGSVSLLPQNGVKLDPH